MEKRLNRSDYVFAITFIFMLVVALGAFFLGLKMGQDRTTAKYEEMNKKQNEAAKGYTAYDQQYLVSFYHTMYLPYREFHKQWFQKIDELQENRSADASLIIKDLAKQAGEAYTALGEKSMPDSSPLLQDAQKAYMQSLKLFKEGLEKHTGSANAAPGGELLGKINADSFVTEAKQFALKAEKNYYDAIVKWNETVNPQFKAMDVTKPISLQAWNTLPLNLKNDYTAQLMSADKLFQPFTPQDLTSRIDEMVHTGQTKKLNQTEVKQVVDALMATDAVRPGDFLRNRSKWYMTETLPQLPFFTNP